MIAFNSDVYDTLKFVHVLAAITWVGSGVYAQVLATRVLRENDPEHLGVVARDIGVMGKTLLMPASISAFAFGIALVAYSPVWNFTDAWVLIGLGGIAATIVTGAGFLGPESGRIAKATKTGGVEAPEVQARIRRIFLVSRVELVLLLAVVFDMVVKPGM